MILCVGYGIAEQFGREGANLVVLDFNQAGLDAAVAMLGGMYGAETVLGVLTDVTKEDAVEAGTS